MTGAQDLRRTQEIFWRLITAPRGVEAGLRELAAQGDEAAGEFDALFRGGDRHGEGGLPAVDRLDIYANMYFYRLLDALKEDYPRVHQALGPARFHNLITDYLLAHPSKHPSLRYLGAELPGFAAQHPLAGECAWLGDLACMEWDRVEIFDAPDGVALSRSDLAKIPQERAGEARFTLIPAFRVRRYEYDVARLWRELKAAGDEAAEQGAPPRQSRLSGISRRATWLRIWRRDFVVYHKAIDEEEAGALDSLGDGAPLQMICQRLAAGMTMERATERFGRLMQGWLDDGLLSSFQLSVD